MRCVVAFVAGKSRRDVNLVYQKGFLYLLGMAQLNVRLDDKPDFTSQLFKNDAHFMKAANLERFELFISLTFFKEAIYFISRMFNHHIR